MKCPVCDVALSISSREGIEIDFCPQCRGVWLDRGELDKIVARSADELASDTRAPRDYDQRDRRYGDRAWDDDNSAGGHDEGRRDRGRRKRGSFLEDLFEFGS